MTKKLNIGVVSELGHVKALRDALNKTEHTVHLLGGNPKRISNKLDVLIVRTKSVSHGAYDKAKAHAKHNNIPMIVEDGATRAIEALDLLTKTDEPEALKPPPVTQRVQKSFKRAPDAISILMKAGGFIHQYMHTQNPEVFLNLMRQLGTLHNERQARACLDYIGAHLTGGKKSIAPAISPVRKKNWAYPFALYSLSDTHVPRRFTGISGTPLNDLQLARMTELWNEAGLKPYLYWDKQQASDAGAALRRAEVTEEKEKDEKEKDEASHKEEVSSALAPTSSDEELNALFEMVREAMESRGIREMKLDGIEVVLRVKHLALDGTTGCGKSMDGGLMGTKYLSQVTCKTCRESTHFRLFMMAHELGIEE